MSYTEKCELARNINATSEVLDELSKHKSIHIKWLVSNNPNTSRETFIYLASLENEYINISLIKDKTFINYKSNKYSRINMPEDICSLVYREHFSHMFKTFFVRFDNKLITPELLRRIYNEPNQNMHVVFNLISNKKCPDDIVDNEYYHPSNYTLNFPHRPTQWDECRKDYLRWRIVKSIASHTTNINIIKECLELIETGKYTSSDRMRRCVYSNPNCPSEIIKHAMHNDSDGYNREYAKRIYYKCLE